jgi:transmembrane sensor
VTNRQWDRSRIEREASDWLIRLDDQPGNDALYSEMEEWLARSPAHRACWEESLNLSAMIETAAPHFEDGRQREPGGKDNVVPLASHRTVHQRLSRYWPKVGMLAAAMIGLLALPDVALRLRADEISGTAQVRKVALSDGSTAFLAPGSALSFDNDGQSRNAQLIRGRAYFDVAHDPRHPFRVSMGDASVTVLGTAFEVDLDQDGASVAVERGLVEVAYPQRELRDRLRVGDAIRLKWRGEATHEHVRSDRIAGWKDGKLFVRNRPIGEVIAELRPWYSGYILIRGSGLDKRRVTGIYDLNNADTALAALAKAHALSVRQITPWLRIVTVS